MRKGELSLQERRRGRKNLSLTLAWGDSRMEDMLNDDSPYCDYSNREDELCGYLESMIGKKQKLPPKFGSFKEKTYICSQELEYYDYGNIGTR